MKIKTSKSMLLMPLIYSMFGVLSAARSQDYFDPALLALDGQSVTTDLSTFDRPGQTPAGSYMVTLFVNEKEHGLHNIVFAADENGRIEPELTPAFLADAGVNITVLPAFRNLPTDVPVRSLASLIPEARVTFDLPRLRLKLSIPQIAMKADARGTVDPALWDDGIPAFLMNYSFNAGHSRQNYRNSPTSNDNTNLFSNFNGGFNWQAWRLRSSMSYVRSESKSGDVNSYVYEKKQFSNTYLQRDIRAWRSNFLAGENATSNDVFDSIPFRGVSLSSSEEMLPASLRGFAPLITGIAQSNARVSIRQNGNIIYQSYVAPGPFRIDDLYQTGEGDLTVTVTEADGSVRTWTQAYSSLPVMQRPGGLKYEVTTGRYNGHVTTRPQETEFMLGTLIYGFPHDVTVYGGSIVAKNYLSAAIGSGLSLGTLGAFSADITHSSAMLHKNQEVNGQSYRMRYSKSLLSTGTTIDLTAYRYSTPNYLSFSDFNNTGDSAADRQVPSVLARQRSSFDVRGYQHMGTWGSFYLSGAYQNYWGQEEANTTLSAGYNGNLGGVTYGLGYAINRVVSGGEWQQNRQLSLNVQVPFSLFSQAQIIRRSYASYQFTQDSQGHVQQNSGLSGTAMDDHLSYSMMKSWDNQGESGSSTLNTSWQGSKGMLSGGYSYNRNMKALNLSGNGGLVVHSGGITLGQQSGSSIALVSAPGADGVEVMNRRITTDNRGYAMVPYISAYENNTIMLNPATLPDNVDLTDSSVNVYPTKGSVVLAKFNTRLGYQALITLTHEGQPIPFGAMVTVDDNKDDDTTGITGDAGQVYLSGISEQGNLHAVWGTASSQQCRAKFNLALATVSDNNPVRLLKLHCEQ